MGQGHARQPIPRHLLHDHNNRNVANWSECILHFAYHSVSLHDCSSDCSARLDLRGRDTYELL